MIVYYKKDGVYRFVSYLKKDEGYDTTLNLRSSKSLEVKQIAFAIDMVEADGYEAHVTSYAEFERVHKDGRMWVIERKTDNGVDYIKRKIEEGSSMYTTDLLEADCLLSEEMARTFADENHRVVGIWTDYVNPKLKADFIIVVYNGTPDNPETMFLAQRLNLKKGISLADCSMKAYRMNLDEAIIQTRKLLDAHVCTDCTIIHAPKENIRCDDIGECLQKYKNGCFYDAATSLNELAGK